MTLTGRAARRDELLDPRRPGRVSTPAASRADAVFDPYVKQSAGVRAFIDAILEGRPASPGFADGVRVQRVLEAVKTSGAEGRVVRIA